MNDDELGRSIATIASWYEPSEPPDTAELDRRDDGERTPETRSSGRGLALIAATAVIVVGGLVALRVVQRNDDSTLPATSSPSVPSTGSVPVVAEPAPVGTDGDDDASTSSIAFGDDVLSIEMASSWSSTSASPLAPRNAAIGVWTGREVLVFGGTELPLCPTCDYAAPPEPILDGAAYDPVADAWRTIAPPPAEVALSSSALSVGEVVYVAGLGESDLPNLWSYSVAADAWSRVDVPANVSLGNAPIAYNDRLVFAYNEITGDDDRDFLYDPETGEWSPLPESPFGPGWFDRSYLSVDGELVLFARRPLADIAPNEPNVVVAAVLGEDSETWQRLPDSGQLEAPYFAEGAAAVSAQQGGADGGKVNGWGRLVPFGGALRLDDQEWYPFTADRAELTWQGGAVGTTSAIYKGVQGEVYDVINDEWERMPTLPNGLGNDAQMTLVAAGLDVFVFGGFDGQLDGMPLTNTSYVLDVDRVSAGASETSDTPGLDLVGIETDADEDGTKQVVLVFDGDLPSDLVELQEDVGSPLSSGIGYTTQTSRDGNGVLVCGATHWFPPPGVNRTVDILVPSDWFDPQASLEYGAINWNPDGRPPAKLGVCKPLNGVVQFFIWGSASARTEDVKVTVDANTITVDITPDPQANE